YCLMGGYMLVLNRDWSVEPSMLIQGNYPERVQVEISCRAVYKVDKNMIWGGLSWRTSDKTSTLTWLVSYRHERKYEFGLAYDMSLFSKKNYQFSSTGTIEVLIGYWFDTLK
ncbi:MAG: type IX secretion system membrane protein PorP/SprF, partial [Bacteroidales bacterium]|nr:type IX secretion system membrane protein PorP/SprF [Bacteroidales bacterium]